MGVPKVRRVAAILAIGGAAAIASCAPTLGSPVLTSTQIDSTVASLTWVGCSTVSRVGEGGHTNVQICAASDARNFGRGSPPASRRAIAKMKNLGGFTEKRWGIKPNQTFIIHLQPNPGSGPALYSVEGPLSTTVPQPYWACAHPKVDSTSRATFGNCGDTTNTGQMPRFLGGRSRGPDAGPESSAAAHRLLDPADGPAWITCTEGCCTTGAL